MTYKITNTIISPEIWCNDKIGWISIPKNANMATRKMMTSVKAGRKEYTDQNPEIMFCVWRNPYDRFVSAIGEYKRRKKDKRPIPEIILAFEKDPSPFDEHLEPQIYYVEHMLHREFDFVFNFETLHTDFTSSDIFDNNLINKYIKPNVASKLPGFEDIKKQHAQDIYRIVNKFYETDLKIFHDRSLILK